MRDKLTITLIIIVIGVFLCIYFIISQISINQEQENRWEELNREYMSVLVKGETCLRFCPIDFEEMEMCYEKCRLEFNESLKEVEFKHKRLKEEFR